MSSANNVILIEDYEQQQELTRTEYLDWLREMRDKYPDVPFYGKRLADERRYPDYEPAAPDWLDEYE